MTWIRDIAAQSRAFRAGLQECQGLMVPSKDVDWAEATAGETWVIEAAPASSPGGSGPDDIVARRNAVQSRGRFPRAHT